MIAPQHWRLRRRSKRWRLMLGVSAASFVFSISFRWWRHIYVHELEFSSPTIAFVDMPRGLGIFPEDVTIIVEDKLSGLADIEIWINQGSKKIQLVSRRSLMGEHRQVFRLLLPGSSAFLKDGEASLTIEAADSSYWHNVSSQSVPLLVDTSAPHLRTLFTPKTLSSGGSALLFYNVEDKNLGDSGVKISSNYFFRGFPARGLSTEFDDPTLYVTLITLPIDIDPRNAELRLYAEDLVGNGTSTPLNVELKATRFKEMAEVYSKEKYQRFIEDMTLRYEDLLNVSGDTITHQRVSSAENEAFVLTRLPRLTDALIRSKMRFSRMDRYWNENLLRQPGKILRSFGTRTFIEALDTIRESTQSNKMTIGLTSESNKVVAVSSGIVVAAESFGILDHGIILDHGLGLHTFYGKLDSTSVAPGTLVKRGDVIGRAKSEPNARPSFTYELRLSGIPADPQPWWNQEWFTSNITDTIRKVSQDLKKDRRSS